MVRPFKAGVDYFPLDVTVDEKIELLEAEHGLIGFGVLVKLYQKIYANNYWVTWNKRSILVFSNKLNVSVNEIKVGDIHYEFGYGMCIKSEVTSQPTRSEDGYWTWQSKQVDGDRVIDYGVREGMTHYGPNLYDYDAYSINDFSIMT